MEDRTARRSGVGGSLTARYVRSTKQVRIPQRRFGRNWPDFQSTRWEDAIPQTASHRSAHILSPRRLEQFAPARTGNLAPSRRPAQVPAESQARTPDCSPPVGNFLPVARARYRADFAASAQTGETLKSIRQPVLSGRAGICLGPGCDCLHLGAPPWAQPDDRSRMCAKRVIAAVDGDAPPVPTGPPVREGPGRHPSAGCGLDCGIVVPAAALLPPGGQRQRPGGSAG